MFGAFGRESGEIRLEVGRTCDGGSLSGFVERSTPPDVVLNTDEWSGYNGVAKSGRVHKTCCHAPGKREWARDDDGDGVREVHSNSMEGVWTGLRNFLRIFRGVSKRFLGQYVGMFEWGHNLKTATDEFLRAMLGVKTPSTA